MHKYEVRSYEELAQDIGKLVTEKQAAYGDSFGKSGEVMRILYPGGIPPDKLDDALTVVRVLDKLFRIATNRDALGESPWQDIAGYSLLSIRRIAVQHSSRVIPPSAYVKEGGCETCVHQPAGDLHLWHCVEKDPNHYEDRSGKEVHNWD